MLKANLIHESHLKELKKVKKTFDTFVPSEFIQGIAKGDTTLRKQFVPSTEELQFQPEELDDPIGDEAYSPLKGLTHRYPDRVLLKPTYLCAVYCRFCFRRYKVSNPKNNLSKDELNQILNYIESHPRIWEVILTGGDPLLLSDTKLKPILNRLKDIKHVSILRFHTKIPIVLPSRISKNLIELLKSTKKSLWIAIHANAPSEFNSKNRSAIKKLSQAGFSLISQSVLLKDVNDKEETLIQLMKNFVELGVKPYYLHYPDLAKGTQSFRIPLSKAIDLVDGLRGKFSGLCQPQLIVDIPKGKGKINVQKQNFTQIGESTWSFESPIDGKKTLVTYPK